MAESRLFASRSFARSHDGRRKSLSVAAVIDGRTKTGDAVAILTLQRLAGNSTVTEALQIQRQETIAGTDPEQLPVLRLNVRKPEVKLLKDKLAEHGALKTPSSTDEFDAATYRAVRVFQWNYGLAPDGAVGRNTWRMLIGPPIVELDEPESIAAFDAAYAKYSDVFAKGQANRRAHGDWGSSPPVAAKPGDYGDTWARYADSVKVGGHLNWRYNNPGNILPGYKEHSFGAYGTALNIAALSGLAIFPTWSAGWSALRSLLRGNYYGPLTLAEAFQKYVGTPAGHKSVYGDDPDAYLRSVTGTTGLSAKSRVRELDDSQLDALMHAIRRVEGTSEGTEYKQGDSLPPLLSRVLEEG